MRYSLLLFFVLCSGVHAQKNPGPRFVSMGSGGAALQGAWSVQQNPAGITGINSPILAVAYQQHGLDPELSTQSAVFIFPLSASALGISFEKYGLDEYKEQQTAFNYARKFGELSISVGFKYHQLTTSQYGSSGTLSAGVGVQFRITERFIVASHLANPGRVTDDNSFNLPVKLSFGISYNFSDRLLMITDVKKALNYPIDVMGGLEYNILECLSLRGGVSANPFKHYTGFGVSYRRIHIDVAVSSHGTLGYAPQISLAYEF